MTIELDRKTIVPAIEWAASFAPRRAVTAAAACVRLTTRDGRLYLTVEGGVTNAQASVPCQGDLDVACSGHDLAQKVKAVSAPTVKLELPKKASGLQVSGGGYKFRLDTVAQNAMRPFEVFNRRAVRDVDGAKLRAGIAAVIWSASDDPSRAQVNSVQLLGGVATACDGRTMAHAPLRSFAPYDPEKTLPEVPDILLPASVAHAIVETTGGVLGLGVEPGFVVVVDGDRVIRAALYGTESVFPPWSQLLANMRFPLVAKCSRAALAEAAKSLLVATDDGVLWWEKRGALATKEGEVKLDLEGELADNIAFSGRTLVEMLGAMQGETVSLLSRSFEHELVVMNGDAKEWGTGPETISHHQVTLMPVIRKAGEKAA